VRGPTRSTLGPAAWSGCSSSWPAAGTPSSYGLRRQSPLGRQACGRNPRNEHPGGVCPLCPLWVDIAATPPPTRQFDRASLFEKGHHGRDSPNPITHCLRSPYLDGVPHQVARASSPITQPLRAARERRRAPLPLPLDACCSVTREAALPRGAHRLQPAGRSPSPRLCPGQVAGPSPGTPTPRARLPRTRSRGSSRDRG
jgi:hypothetical protein